MESLILASYVLRLGGKRTAETDKSYDEATSRQSARTLASLAISIAGFVVFAAVLSLAG